MSHFQVKKYTTEEYSQWNAFVSGAKNATFLFHRDFMEYHQDRFEDCSLMVFENEKIVAILPANRLGKMLLSHQGLSYGGLVYTQDLRLTSVVSIFAAVLKFLEQIEITTLQLKLLPTFYHQKPAQEIDYVLFLLQAKLIRRDSSSLIDLSQKVTFSKLRKRGISKAVKNQLVIKEENQLTAFWSQVLIPNLKNRHEAQPVHSIEEITLLKAKFPLQIKQFSVYKDDIIVAGTTIFESNNVAHCQYISKYEGGENLGSLDFLFQYLITEKYKNKRYFDFGISNEEQGRKLNKGLSNWKESFGASTAVHDFYEIEIAKYPLLENCMI
ncbi:GNAT family N-acetyltransferase [Flavobacterium faecale]|uniref:GNAT family N-acetyltransferase n=1 Tax=Flavobacterium faecale TaxID=1355330 RepID=A0A2S1LD84_9FLAO|nr:GNAT family N-acetyltransferase [Flavobacterium faecale]AWG21694.1 GNAT family N-acetyltransferase [Flavobacterium faecale]